MLCFKLETELLMLCFQELLWNPQIFVWIYDSLSAEKGIGILTHIESVEQCCGSKIHRETL